MVDENLARAERVENLDEWVVMSANHSGHGVLRVGFTVRLFLRGGDQQAVRHHVVDRIVDFAAAGGPNITHYQKDMANRMTRIGDKDLAARLHAEVDRIDPEIDYYGPHVTDDDILPPRWRGTAMLTPSNAPRDLSDVNLAFPASLAMNDPDGVIARVVSWCEQVGPVHGLGGFGLVYERGMDWSHQYETWLMLQRYSGLDYAGPYLRVAIGVNAISSVNWLTVLGSVMIDEIGGAHRLRERLVAAAVHFDVGESEAPLLYWFDDGVVIRAGVSPELGDRLNEGVPVAYQVVNKALRPWLFTDYQQSPNGLIRVPDSVDPLQATLDWVTRFDVATDEVTDATVDEVGDHV